MRDVVLDALIALCVVFLVFTAAAVFVGIGYLLARIGGQIAVLSTFVLGLALLVFISIRRERDRQ